MAREFGAQATRAIGDKDLNALQEELDLLRGDATKLTQNISEQKTQKAELEDRLRQRRDGLETELKDIVAAEGLRTRLVENRKQHERVTKNRGTTLAHLAGELESTELLASLASGKIGRAYEMLRPLYEKGHIPLKHLNFVRDLLQSGTCVCGRDLSEDGVHRRHVADRIAESAEQEERANYLGQLHDAAKSLRDHAEATSWDDRSTQLAGDLAALDKELADLGLERRDIDNKLKDLDEEKIQVIRDEIATIETQVDNLNRNLAINEDSLPRLTSKIDSLEKQIHQRQRNERAAADKRAAETMATLLVNVLQWGLRYYPS